jgi:hypothetical protein
VAAPARDQLVDGLGSGAGLEGATTQVHAAVNSAFVDALSAGLLVSAGAALVGALLSWALIRDHRPAVPAEQEATAAEALAA